MATSESERVTDERVLVIFPGALGDLICLIPALRALLRRHRGAALELMAREELARFAVARIGLRIGLRIGVAFVALLVIFTTSHDILRLVGGGN